MVVYENPSYGKYNTFGSEELKQLLKKDLASPGNDSLSTEEILCITQILKDREISEGSYKAPDIDKVWDNFQKLFSRVAPQLATGVARTPPHKYRRLLVLAALIAALAGLTFTAQAFGPSIFNALVQWTEETFHMEIRESTEKSPYAGIVLDESGLPPEFTPAWIPNGFVQGKATVVNNQNVTVVSVPYNNENSSFLISLLKYSSSSDVPERVFEKNDVDIESYLHGDMLFYLTPNDEVYTAAWSGGALMYQISGNLSRETLTKIIDSVGG